MVIFSMDLSIHAFLTTVLNVLVFYAIWNLRFLIILCARLGYWRLKLVTG